MTASTATAAPIVSTGSTAISTRDFSQLTTDPNRDRWTLGTMRYVVEALDGAPVAIITDSQTGCAEVGVRLVGVRTSGDSNPGERVVVERTFSDGTTSRTNFRVDSIGSTIFPLDERGTTGAKWRAIDAHRTAKSAAIAEAREAHGEAEGREWGAWHANPVGIGAWDVRYEPHTGNDYYADKWGTRGHWRIGNYYG